MTAYYNEWDPYAAAWLRNLINEGLIPKGDVDERSIKEVSAADLLGYDQCHFFAGIGGWAYALRLAGWPDDRAVWTGSCPCQPFSAAGKRKGTADDRHLWPEFRRLIAERNPSVVFGEQVASKDGRLWLVGVRTDLEALGYAVGAADLCAAGVGAPHIRQRIWFVADSHGGLARHAWEQRSGQHGQQPADGGVSDVWLGSPNQFEFDGRRDVRPRGWGEPTDDGGMGFAEGQRRQWRQWRQDDSDEGRRQLAPGQASTGASFWSAFDVIPCRDGKARRVEPGTFPLAHGIPNRVGKLRAFGNAIVPQVAAEFISAYLETLTKEHANQ